MCVMEMTPITPRGKYLEVQVTEDPCGVQARGMVGRQNTGHSVKFEFQVIF